MTNEIWDGLMAASKLRDDTIKLHYLRQDLEKHQNYYDRAVEFDEKETFFLEAFIKSIVDARLCVERNLQKMAKIERQLKRLEKRLEISKKQLENSSD